MTISITGLFDAGNDVLLVRGTTDAMQTEDGDPLPIEARGWISATSNHFDPEYYGDDGHRKPGATARAMTKDEQRAYATGLLEVVEAQVAASTLREIVL